MANKGLREWRFCASVQRLTGIRAREFRRADRRDIKRKNVTVEDDIWGARAQLSEVTVEVQVSMGWLRFLQTLL